MYYKRSNDLSAWNLLRLNSLIVVLQNCVFLESKELQVSLLAVILCYNIKFLICFFFDLVCFLIEFFLDFLNTKIYFYT